MTGQEWAALALFAGVAVGLSFLDPDLAVGFVVIIGTIIVITTIS